MSRARGVAERLAEYQRLPTIGAGGSGCCHPDRNMMPFSVDGERPPFSHPTDKAHPHTHDSMNGELQPRRMQGRR